MSDSPDSRVFAFKYIHPSSDLVKIGCQDRIPQCELLAQVYCVTVPAFRVGIQNFHREPVVNSRESVSTEEFRPDAITRPAPSLMRYYILCSLIAGPFFPIVLIPLLCKYLTLRYRFEDSGIAMQWGVLFRKEIYLTHRRIQDIHLTRNIVQRWFGLATVAVQTASGSATPEMSIEGILEANELRDHLYSKMRGARTKGADEDPIEEADGDEALTLLTEIRDSMRKIAESGSLR